ncbi:MAG: thiamine phosphate synthase [Stagnimonas sp.]|nr:thiamine phosphate synthase [Stagnimonas sp.]
MRLPRRGLYAITSAAICRDALTLLRAVEQAIEGGAVIVQYRDKLNEAATRHRHALQLQDLCRQAGVPLILNDGPAADVATLQLDGMHLGEDDGALVEARRLCPDALIGATCGQSLEKALQAQAAGASYVAFGAFYPSATKPLAARAPLELLGAARAQLYVPLCAIGGITPHNAAPLIAAGAHFIAAVEGVFGSADVKAAASAYAQLFGA